jgi:two-component system cell cycle response regulator CtrA
MRILLVEDDPATATHIKLMLIGANFDVRVANCGETALELVEQEDFQMIIMELGLPDFSGHDVLYKLRLTRVDTPVIMLSCDDTTEAKVKAFGLGADDFLTKPFHGPELIARIKAVVHRCKPQFRSIIQTGKIALNLDARMVDAQGSPVPLSAKEYQVFELLSLRKGSVLPKRLIRREVYADTDRPELKTIDVIICNLRRKLSKATGGESYICTDWGHGYVLRNP